ncbi:thioredoxin reductase [Actinoplanes sp. G11-F43]|uniref:thioredoxin reductase n=1 Tax=Actinoplanes sp. G11-F43 TaxID=3424130 RepID=UPI003D34F6A1
MGVPGSGGRLAPDGSQPFGSSAAARAELIGYGIVIVPGTVVSLTPTLPVGVSAGMVAGDAGFLVRLGSGKILSTRRVLLATGPLGDLPAIPGLAERWGREVLPGPYEHGYELRDRPLGVLGGSPDSVQLALLVRQWSADVAYFAHTRTPAGDERQRLTSRGIRIVEGRVTRLIRVDDRLAGIELDRASVVAPHAFFVRPVPPPCNGLLTALGAVVIDSRTGRTTVPGLWSADDLIVPQAPAATAAGAGLAAAVDLHTDLIEEDVRAALPFSAAQERRVAALRVTL